MSERTDSSWQKHLLSTALATVALLFVLQVQVAAQDEIQFGAFYNCPKSNLYNFKVLECSNEKYCKVLMVNTSTPSASFEAEVSKSKILDAFKAGGCTIEENR